MVRVKLIYGNSTDKEQKKYNYTLKDVSDALERIKLGGSIRVVAAEFGIPFESLRRFHRDGLPTKLRKHGLPLLTTEEELLIVEAAQSCYRANQPLDKLDIRLMVQEYLNSIGRKTKCPENLPGKRWMRWFCNRNANLSLRNAEVLTQNRSKCLSKGVIDKFYDTVLLPVLHDHEITSPAEYPRVFNLDEVGLNPNPTSGPVFATKGDQNVYQLTPNSVKKMTTVNFKGKNLQSTHCVGGPQGAVYSCTSSGWMEGSVFETYTIKVFIPFVASYKKPVILTYDGHGSHLTYITIKASNIFFRKYLFLLNPRGPAGLCVRSCTR